MGIAISMATEMRLHREETFKQITEDSTREARIRAESARRTLVSAFMVEYSWTSISTYLSILFLVVCRLTLSF